MPKFLHAVFFLLIAFTSQALPAEQPFDPLAVYLTWQKNPESSMTIHWISAGNQPEDSVYYKPEGAKEWRLANGSHKPLPEGHTEYLIHTTELTGLEPDTPYVFAAGHNGKVFKFKTMPAALNRPLRFVVGGDLYHDDIEDVVVMNRIAAAKNIDFALLGGDIAYATDKYGQFPEKMEKWLTFLEAWKNSMITKEGYLIPLLPVISNEDTKKRYAQKPEQAAFFYALFATPGLPGYNVIDFANYLSIFLLDSGHTNYISGKQKVWLADALKARANVPVKFALYHVPAYPSVRNLSGIHGTLIRAHWVPSFEKYNLTAAFENHDHAYKRTELIKGNKVDPAGVLYIGDGGWGVATPREPAKASERWYLAATAAKQNIVIVTIYPDNSTFYQAIDRSGNIFDQFLRPNKMP